MVWQDILFSAGGFIFTLTLLPTLLDSESKVPAKTSVTTACVVTAYTYAFLTLDMPLSALGNASNAVAWWSVAAFRR